MKRIWCLCLALCLCLCGCAPKARPVPSAPPTRAPASRLAVFGAFDQPWSQAALEGARAWCGQAGWELVAYDCLGAASTLELQVADLERSGGAELAVVCAVTDRESLAAAALSLAEQGIPTLTLANRPLDPPAGALGHLGPDSGQTLDVAAAFFRQELAPGTGVVIVHDIDTDPLEAAAGSALEGAGVPVAATTYTWGSVDYAQSFLGQALQGQSGLGGVLCFSRTGALGARAALEEAGLAGTVRLLCLDGSQAVLDDQDRGELEGVVTLQADDLAARLQDALTQAAQGKRLEDSVPLTAEARRRDP